MQFNGRRLSRQATVSMFPRLWVSGPTTQVHVAFLCGVPGTTELTTHSIVGGIWVPRRIEHYVAHQEIQVSGERPRVPPLSWCLTLHDKADTSADPPVGFIAFTPELAGGKEGIDSLHLEIHLAWVAPDKRHEGYGRHLAANLCRYLTHHGCAVRGTRLTTERGAEVTISMPVPDRTAVRFADYLREFFNAGRNRRWQARAVSIEPA